MGFENVPLVKGMSAKDIERRSLELIHECRPDLLDSPLPAPVDEIAEFDIDTQYRIGFSTDFLLPHAEGMMIPGETPEIILDQWVHRNLKMHQPRARFSGAHEIGHGVLHGRQLKDRLLSGGKHGLYRRSDIKPFLDPEWQANKYAAFLLMPTATMQMAIAEYGPNVRRLADLYRVSPESMSYRLRDFGYHMTTKSPVW